MVCLEVKLLRIRWPSITDGQAGRQILFAYLGPNAFTGIQTKVSNHKLPDNVYSSFSEMHTKACYHNCLPPAL